MKFWVYSTNPRTCGKCNRTIRVGEIALRLALQSAPTVKLWRCTDCVGPPPEDVIATAETINTEAAARRASIGERLDALTRRLTGRPADWKTKQAGEDVEG